MAKKNQSLFKKRIIDTDANDIITLECNHLYKIHDKSIIKDNRYLCTQCVNEYLISRNKEINEYLKSPIIKPLPPK